MHYYSHSTPGYIPNTTLTHSKWNRMEWSQLLSKHMFGPAQNTRHNMSDTLLWLNYENGKEDPIAHTFHFHSWYTQQHTISIRLLKSLCSKGLHLMFMLLLELYSLQMPRNNLGNSLDSLHWLSCFICIGGLVVDKHFL